MKLLRFQIPLLYLASLLLAGALHCVPLAGDPGQHAALDHAAHHAETAAVHDCPEGDVVCACGEADPVVQLLLAKSRDVPSGKKVGPVPEIATVSPAAPVHVALADPPERKAHRVSAYDGIHGRAARLLI
ncbi:hypothetical protein [Parvibaculum sp.]|jgi:hypothetical protein|uniref:hypothetical protein n=1 Tax=Parvibaculum sp. TaxID=2024848 RepID=UPI001B16957A|nr:hypothetical protein [Parvibaculum sp.]MBO6633922.1 hypothetical protein [Parvibaculum sp.]MBO6678281.1 hypothetical protein [Parvibaculum sp.]MBO6684504.1 hypothetical protein [Parvibaculum sp.]MBO6904591.1 hypothetical protein [Parvibaculum sp.]